MRRGSRLEIAYYDQQRAQLDLDAPVAHNINARSDFVLVNGQNRHISGYLRDFLFRPDQLLTPARALSGGERNRLLLARLFAQPANMLVLDEPTNDLDIDTLELLQELVADFAGTLLLVSHDRAFLDNVVTSLLVLEGDGRVQDFVGGYSDWARWRDERDAMAGAAASESRPRLPCARRPAAAPRRAASFRTRTSASWRNCPRNSETSSSAGRNSPRTRGDPSFYSQPHTEVAADLAALAELDVADRGGLRALGGAGGQLSGERRSRPAATRHPQLRAARRAHDRRHRHERCNELWPRFGVDAGHEPLDLRAAVRSRRAAHAGNRLRQWRQPGRAGREPSGAGFHRCGGACARRGSPAARSRRRRGSRTCA